MKNFKLLLLCVVFLISLNYVNADTCSWGCVMSLPSSTVSCSEGETFTMRGYWQFTGGSCPETRVILAQRNITGYENMTGSGNLSKQGTNPVILPMFDFENPDSWQDWDVTCNNAGNYTVRVTCDGIATAKQNVNVINPLSVGCPITNVGSSVTLTGLNQSCINISSNNVVFDCAGNKMNVTYMTGYNPFAFNINGYSNITIKNCNNIQNYNNGFIVNNASNVTIFNNSFKNYYYRIVGGDTLYGVYIKNVTRLNFSNNIISNTSGTCTATGCGLRIYNMYYNSNYSVFSNNFFNGVVKYDKNNIAPDPTIVIHIISYGNYNNWSNNVFKNYTDSSNLFYLYGSNNVFVNNTFSYNPNTALYLYSGDYNIFNGLTMTNISGTGIQLESNNNSFNNVNINNTGYCFSLGRSYFDAGCDCDIVTYAWNNTINNSVLNCSTKEIISVTSATTKGNKFYNTSLIQDKLSGNMFEVWNYVVFNVTNTTAVPNVMINVSNNAGTMVYRNATNSNGLTNLTLIKHYDGTYWDNHTINASNATFSFITTANFSQSRIPFNINITTSGGAANTCTYGGSGDWNVICSDNCPNIYVPHPNYLYIDNTVGVTKVNASRGLKGLTKKGHNCLLSLIR